MPSPSELAHLALRIEVLQKTDTHGWIPGDDMEFRRGLPGRDAMGRLPAPEELRSRGNISEGTYRDILNILLRLEDLVHRNHNWNPSKMMYNMSRGKIR